MNKDNFVDGLIKDLRGPDENFLELLHGRSKEEMAVLMQEELSPEWLILLRTDAEEAGNNEVIQIIDQIEAAYQDRFTITFSHPDVTDNKGRVVRFTKNGISYYHVDYNLGNSDQGQLVMLYRRPDSSWWSEDLGAQTCFLPHVGRAIDRHENYKPM